MKIIPARTVFILAGLTFIGTIIMCYCAVNIGKDKPEVKPVVGTCEIKPYMGAKMGARIEMDTSKTVAMIMLDTDPFYIFYAGGAFTLDYREAKQVLVKDTCKLKEEFNRFIADSTKKYINNRLPVVVVDSGDVFIHSGKGQQHNNTGSGKQIIINK